MHVKGHVRDAFWTAVAFMREEGGPSKTSFFKGLAHWIEEDGSRETVQSLTGKLLHCTDILPQQGRDLKDLGVEFRLNTYAAATRAILREG